MNDGDFFQIFMKYFYNICNTVKCIQKIEIKRDYIIYTIDLFYKSNLIYTTSGITWSLISSIMQ